MLSSLQFTIGPLGGSTPGPSFPSACASPRKGCNLAANSRLCQQQPVFLRLKRGLGATLLAGVLAASAQAQSSVTLAWDPSIGSGVAGYRLYEGGASGAFTNVIDVGGYGLAECIRPLGPVDMM